MKKLLYIISILVLVGCGASKKTTSESEETIDKSIIENTNLETQITGKEDTSSVSTQNQEESEESYEYEGTAGDTLKIIKKGPDGKTLSETILTGSGKGKISNKHRSENTQINNSSVTDKKEFKSEKKAISETSVLKQKEVKKSKDFFSLWNLIWMLLLLINIIIYLKYRFNSNK